MYRPALAPFGVWPTRTVTGGARGAAGAGTAALAVALVLDSMPPVAGADTLAAGTLRRASALLADDTSVQLITSHNPHNSVQYHIAPSPCPPRESAIRANPQERACIVDMLQSVVNNIFCTINCYWSNIPSLEGGGCSSTSLSCSVPWSSAAASHE